jgi:hypothetical protein
MSGGQLFEMDKSRSTSRISSGEALASFVMKQRQALAESYEGLAVEMAKFGETKLEAIYRSLVDDAVPHSALETQSASGAPANGVSYVPVPAKAGLPDVASLSTPYAIWAFAVSNEVQLFERLVAVNISIDSSLLQSALAAEALACLDRAANYRTQRRLAFHAGRLSDEIAQFPDIRRIDTIEDFAHVALAIEHYFQRLFENYDGSAGDISDIVEASGSAISYLEPMAKNAAISKRLENPLKRLARVTSRMVGGTATDAHRMTQIALEADRIFDYYDRVFETAQDLQITRASQHLSASTLDRLRSLRILLGAAGFSGKTSLC